MSDDLGFVMSRNGKRQGRTPRPWCDVEVIDAIFTTAVDDAGGPNVVVQERDLSSDFLMDTLQIGRM